VSICVSLCSLSITSRFSRVNCSSEGTKPVAYQVCLLFTVISGVQWSPAWKYSIASWQLACWWGSSVFRFVAYCDTSSLSEQVETLNLEIVKLLAILCQGFFLFYFGVVKSTFMAFTLWRSSSADGLYPLYLLVIWDTMYLNSRLYLCGSLHGKQFCTRYFTSEMVF
jgi:hypothetical protein